MLDELKRLKEGYPDRILIASIMEEYNRSQAALAGQHICAHNTSNVHSICFARLAWLEQPLRQKLVRAFVAELVHCSPCVAANACPGCIHSNNCTTCPITCLCFRDAWDEIIERCEAVGVDAFEINFSCPHGMPERKMGMVRRATMGGWGVRSSEAVRILGKLQM
jgi:hypothetical protein